MTNSSKVRFFLYVISVRETSLVQLMDSRHSCLLSRACVTLASHAVSASSLLRKATLIILGRTQDRQLPSLQSIEFLATGCSISFSRCRSASLFLFLFLIQFDGSQFLTWLARVDFKYASCRLQCRCHFCKKFSYCCDTYAGKNGSWEQKLMKSCWWNQYVSHFSGSVSLLFCISHF